MATWRTHSCVPSRRWPNLAAIMGHTFIMAGGGTGGHVIPAIAVAHELAARGHRPVFIGTDSGFEARLVPASRFVLESIQIGGLKRVSAAQRFRTLGQLPRSVTRVLELLAKYKPSAIFSMGGYVAGPVMLAGAFKRVPMVVMEPNAIPGFTSRRMSRFIARALLSFPQAARYFPRGRTEVTGVPVRSEFFALGPKPFGERLTVLITGGSRGSRTLNQAARTAWPLFRDGPFWVELLHQTGAEAYEAIDREFMHAGLAGEVLPFINDMPDAFARADLIVCRSGAGAVAEVMAAAKPSILVPFPFAADQHQLRNAEALVRSGAAKLVLDKNMDGRRLFEEVEKLAGNPDRLRVMGQRAREMAHPDAARRAAEILEDVAHG